jgi:signal transduction histidine kinase
LELAGLGLLAVVPLAGVLAGCAATMIGVLTPLTAAVHAGSQLARQYRAAVGNWTQARIDEPYRAPRPDTGPGWRPLRSAQRNAQRSELHRLTRDPATQRELLWLVCAPVLAVLMTIVPFVLGTYALTQLLSRGLWTILSGDYPAPVHGVLVEALNPQAALGAEHAWLTIPVGAVFTAAYFLVMPSLLSAQLRIATLLLAPTEAERLAERVAELTTTRAQASSAQALELRRIERDLHDGAQARMVAVGIALRTMQGLLDTDPEAVRKLIVQARTTSAAALADLRDLVRGIHPPVLAERGLADALRALALDCPVPATAEVDLPGRLDAPIEAAVYFVVSELLTNIAKHAGANRAQLTARYDRGRLLVRVQDDGHGGADPARGSGLRGAQRRLATFDGTLLINSPTGGPTVANLEMQCALSSPRTSTSSESA